MKQIAKSLLLISAIAGAGSVNADCCWWEDLCMSPFIGVDYKQTWMKGHNDWNHVASKSYPGGTVYVGSRFGDCFGLELGYSATSRKNRSATIGSGTFGGVTFTGNQELNARVRLQSVHLDLNGYLAMDDCGCWELIGSIGIASMKPKINATAGTGTFTTEQRNVFNSINGKNRGIARIGVGTQYFFCDMIGARAIVRWENTSNLRVNANNNSAFNVTGKPFKDAVSLALGLFLQW